MKKIKVEIEVKEYVSQTIFFLALALILTCL